MLDNVFTLSIKEWLDTEEDKRDLHKGAEMLLKLNRNQYMYMRIVKRKNMALLVYQLQKHYKIRVDGMTIDQVAKMDSEVMTAVQQTLIEDAPALREAPEDDVFVLDADADMPSATRRGKRDDHEELPAEIQELYKRGGDLYYKIKEVHHTLSTMLDSAPCDRYEYCHQLKQLHDEYRLGWETYDNYGKVMERQLTQEQSKQISAARKYLSTNKAKLSTLNGEEYQTLHSKMQERVDFLLSLSQTFTPDFEQELIGHGLVFSHEE